MTQLLLALFHVLTLVLLPGLALAQAGGEKLVVADCAETGCRCRLTDIDAESLEFLLGPDLPPGAIGMTMVRWNGEMILSPLSPDEVHLVAGGSGRCDLELFPPILPQDGTWAGEVRVEDSTGCRPEVAAMVPGIAAGMETTRRIAWDGQFHPAKLADGGDSAALWVKKTPTHFAGRLQVPQSGLMTVNGGLTATLTAPDRATATLRLRIAVTGGDAAVLAAAGMADCRTVAVYSFRRIGN